MTKKPAPSALRAPKRAAPSSYSQIPDQVPAGKPAAPRSRWLPLVVAFIAGWAIMQIEILGGRVLAPYFGYSIYQWGALIGVVMTALAIGYALGGWVGDRPGSRRFLPAALTIAFVYAGLIPLIAEALLPSLRALGPAWGAVVSSIALLGIPSLLLATTSPIVVKAIATEKIATSAGRVYSVSTAGSIAGTFFTAFLVIPEIGTRLGHYLAAALIAVAVVLLLVEMRAWRGLAAAAVALALAYPHPGAPEPGVIYRAESIHNIIEVQDSPDERGLYLNYTTGVQTLEKKGRLLTGEYFDLFLLGPYLTEGRKVLMLGAAGGMAMKQIATVYPDADITGVDLDPAVLRVARDYFGLKDQPRIKLVAEDARWFLTRTLERYDVIVVDLYVTGTIPFFTATAEFFALAKSRLNEKGVLLINVLSRRRGDEHVAPFVKTLQTAFPSVYAASFFNYIFIATNVPTDFETLKARIDRPAANADLDHVLARIRPTFRVAVAGPDVRAFTDDRNDVEMRSFDLLYGHD